MLKKITACTLLFALSLNFEGFYIIFKIQQLQIRSEIKRQIREGLQDDELADIIVDHHNRHLLEWEHDREFTYLNMRYDVLTRTELGDGKTIFRCIRDTDETRLIAERQSLQSDPDGGSDRSLTQVFKFFSGLYFSQLQSGWSLSSSEFCYMSSDPCSCDRYFTICDPPPDVI